MKSNLLLYMALLAAGSTFAAETNNADVVKGAVAKLKGQTNYSWTAKLEMPGMGFTPSPMDGKTEKDGFTLITQEFNDNKLQAALKGDKAAVETEEGWVLLGGAAGGEPNFAVMIGQWLTRNKTAAHEAETLLGNAKELKAGDAGLISGDLKEDGVKEMLSFGPRGSGAPAPKNPKGQVKFWVKDGALTKFESHITGTTSFGPDGEEREVDMTRTIEVKDIGTTKFEVPAEAKKKLEAK